MNMFSRALAVVSAGLAPRQKSLVSPDSGRGGWYPLIRESFAGAWQRNITVDAGAVQAHHAVFACQTRIASDIAKLRIKLVKEGKKGVWGEYKDPKISGLLRKPNRYQTRPQFVESWVLSRLQRGNTYVLVERNGLGEYVSLHILNPDRVKPLVAPDGAVFYELQADNMAGLQSASVTVPARYIIHDRVNCLFHPLVGISPIFACGLAATQGLNIQTSQARLFKNAGRPGGLLIAPGRIDVANAKELKETWDANFSGENAGKIAVLGDGMKFEKLSLTAEESQLIDQLKLTADIVCSTFHVPPFMIGMGAVPALGSIESLHLLYYGSAVQSPIEAIEACLDDGLGLPADKGVEFDIEGLARMDTASRITTLAAAVGGTIMTPNEARARLDLPSVAGGDAVYAQQQDFSIEALADRDRNKPFATPTGAPQA